MCLTCQGKLGCLQSPGTELCYAVHAMQVPCAVSQRCIWSLTTNQTFLNCMITHWERVCSQFPPLEHGSAQNSARHCC